ncbi:MAG TPA: phosphopantetheine-binding protein [Acidimicrobiales bacterium]
MTGAVALEKQIADIVREVLQIEVASPDDDLVATGLFDSLAVVSLIAEIEVVLGYELPLDEFEVDSFRTVGRIAAFVDPSRSSQGVG